MSTKVKGLLKGLRYISQIFEDEKEPEMQIGLPTDVKHVAHIGWDGPSIDSPSWMKEFPSQTGFQSAPLGPPGELGENPEIKWVSAGATPQQTTTQTTPRERKTRQPDQDIQEGISPRIHQKVAASSRLDSCKNRAKEPARPHETSLTSPRNHVERSPRSLSTVVDPLNQDPKAPTPMTRMLVSIPDLIMARRCEMPALGRVLFQVYMKKRMTID